MGFLPWEIQVAFPGESQLRQSLATQPTTHAGCLTVSIIHRTLTRTNNPLNSDMDYRIFIVRTDVHACDCTRGCTDTEREAALKVDSGKKIPCSTGESNLRQRRDGPITKNYIPPQGGIILLKGSNSAEGELFS